MMKPIDVHIRVVIGSTIKVHKRCSLSVYLDYVQFFYENSFALEESY